MSSIFDISLWAIGLFGLSLLCSVVALGVFLWRIMPVHGKRRADKRRVPSDNPPTVPASIIVYSIDQSVELEALLPQLLSQHYAPGYEVIVVNEGDSPRVSAVVADLQLQHRNLYLTFTPEGARNLSRKKLAITIGIKAARYPVVVLTTAGAVISGTEWLGRLMQHFHQDSPVEVVLGMAAPVWADDCAPGKRIRSFDLAADTLTWIYDAISGRPWRGTEYNLAYRRDLFFKNKGFSRHLNLRHGDDDIFISEIANGRNTVVELSDQSVVEIPGATTPRAAYDRNVQRRFTRRFIHGRPRLVTALGWWAYLIALAAALAGALIDPHSLTGWICAAVCLTAWALTAMVWRNALIAMRGRRLMLTLPLIAAMRPVRKIIGRMTVLFSRGKRYTWE